MLLAHSLIVERNSCLLSSWRGSQQGWGCQNRRQTSRERDFPTSSPQTILPQQLSGGRSAGLLCCCLIGVSSLPHLPSVITRTNTLRSQSQGNCWSFSSRLHLAVSLLLCPISLQNPHTAAGLSNDILKPPFPCLLLISHAPRQSSIILSRSSSTTGLLFLPCQYPGYVAVVYCSVASDSS